MEQPTKRRYEPQPETCTVEGCGKRTVARSWCGAHYRRWRLKGEPGPALERFPGRGQCRVPGCDHVGRLKAGMCVAHHHRQIRYGDPNVRKGAANGEPEDWIRAHADYAGDGCLTWPFARTPDGYGKATRGGSPIGASRLMCMVAHGEPPTGSHEAAHSCGNGREGCVNPRHLRWATPVENQSDKVAHGTTYRGERHWSAKLTEVEVKEIRALLGTMSQAAIARLYGVDPSAVSEIKSGKTWGWLS